MPSLISVGGHGRGPRSCSLPVVPHLCERIWHGASSWVSPTPAPRPAVSPSRSWPYNQGLLRNKRTSLMVRRVAPLRVVISLSSSIPPTVAGPHRACTSSCCISGSLMGVQLGNLSGTGVCREQAHESDGSEDGDLSAAPHLRPSPVLDHLATGFGTQVQGLAEP